MKPQTISQLITKLEQQHVGDYCFEAGCVEPGCDNCNTIMRRNIAKFEA